MSQAQRHEEIPRAEGDLRISWDEEDGRIARAWCTGTMYRGYEMILIGRYPQDALDTTARLCGICSTSQVVAATHALEDAWRITPPPQAVRLRNLFLAAETTMSDARQAALFFGPGLCHDSFSWHPLHGRIVAAFQPRWQDGWRFRWAPPPSGSWASSPRSPCSGRTRCRFGLAARPADH